MSLIRHRRRTFLLCRETRPQKWARMLVKTGKTFVDPSAMTNERGLRLLEFATFNDLMLENMFGHHKASRRWTWHSPNGQHHNQIDYILVRKHFWSGVSSARTWSFPGADIGSDHDLLLMTFHLRLKRISKPKHTRFKFDFEKLKDPNVLETFQAMIGGKFVPLTIMNNEDRPGFNDHHLQHSSDWNSQWDPWQTSSEEKALDHCRNSWTVRQKERTEKEKIWAWRIWEIQGSEQQNQEVHEKG